MTPGVLSGCGLLPRVAFTSCLLPDDASLIIPSASKHSACSRTAPDELAELRGVLLREHEWRVREGL
jgi:hypothetical protein